jgi:hypothetical protein
MLTIVVIIAFFMSGSCLVLLTSYESCNKGTFHCAQRPAAFRAAVYAVQVLNYILK